MTDIDISTEAVDLMEIDLGYATHDYFNREAAAMLRALRAKLTEVEARATAAAQQLAEAREVLDWFVKNAKGIEADVRSGHQSRANAASEWMREDDRGFRADLSKTLEAARAFLTRTEPPHE